MSVVGIPGETLNKRPSGTSYVRWLPIAPGPFPDLGEREKPRYPDD
jgi:hypothetical protein